MKISAVIITKNEEKHIGQCLASLAFADEVIVVDSGSTDRTLQIAEAYGARVFHQDWLGFGPQRQKSVSLASNDWVFAIDADEEVSEDLSASFLQLDEPAEKPAVFQINRCNRFLGRFLRHGDGYPDRVIRVFDRRVCNYSSDRVHEKVELSARCQVKTLSGDLIHHQDESLERFLQKQNEYTSLQAESMAAKGKRAGAVRLVISPAVRFFKYYFVKQGFLDGIPGLIHCTLGAVITFLKYAKLRELQK